MPLFDFAEYRAVYEGEFGRRPLRTRITYHGDPEAPSCQIKGLIETLDGKVAGEFSTLLRRRCHTTEARLQLIELNEAYRRAGFARHFIESLELLYSRTGVDVVRMHAAHYKRDACVGGSYVCALLGYDFDVGEDDDAARATLVAKLVDGALASGRITVAEYDQLKSRLFRQGKRLEGMLQHPWEVAELDGGRLGQAILRWQSWDGIKYLT